MRLLPLLLAAALAGACGKQSSSKQLDVNSIEVVDNARLRTDTVGEAQFASTSTFVLVDAKNPTPDGAYITLAGDLRDQGGAVVGQLKAQSLWIPPGEIRTYALIDTERVARPATTGAKIVVTGALVTHDPPRVRITDAHSFVDTYVEADKPVSRIVAQANVVNDADRIGKVIVIAAFHGADKRPITRPYQVLEIDRKQTKPIQFVGPPGSTVGTIFVGDVVY